MKGFRPKLVNNSSFIELFTHIQAKKALLIHTQSPR